MPVMPSASPAMIENRTFDEIRIGDQAEAIRTLTKEDIDLFAIMSGDVNPAHLDAVYAETDMFHKIIGHGMWGGALISTVLGTKLPGPGTIYLGQELRFRRPVGIGDTITTTLTVVEKREETGDIILDCVCTNQSGKAVITGRAEVRAPTEKVRRAPIALPDIRFSRHEHSRRLLERAQGGEAVVTAVAHPCDPAALSGAIEGARAGLITPILVGPESKIRAVADAQHLDLSGLRIIDVPHSHAAADQAVALVRSGEADLLMKGSLHTDELMHAVMAKDTGLRTARRVSHVYIMDVPGHPRPLFITDAAITIAPSLEDKRDIIQNAIDLARVLGVETPRVAVLSAVETLTPKLQSTLDAAALSKMADRGQISGGLVDGPLAFDNAINEAAAKEKGIVSSVAGRADILVVPDLVAGNMLAKQLSFLAGADAAGVVLGARVPIILTSRADSERTRIASCAVAVLIARAAAGQTGISA